jgi:hypothetical protein
MKGILGTSILEYILARNYILNQWASSGGKISG